MSVPEPVPVTFTGGRKREKLLSRVRQQLEFYFGDANLDKDRFLGEKIKEDPNGFVDIAVLLTFNKLRLLTTEEHVVRDAIRGSTFFELSPDGKRVHRTKEFVDFGPTDERTLYVENLAPLVDHDWIKSKFSPFGKVLYVSLPRFKLTKAVKGFAFVEFDSPEAVHLACDYFANTATASDAFKKEDALPAVQTVTADDFDEDELSAKHGSKRKRDDATDEETAVEAIPENQPGDPAAMRDPKTTKRHPPPATAKPPTKDKKKGKSAAAGMLPLKAMPKLKWLELRAKYLDMQKASFRVLKQKLKIMDVTSGASENNNVDDQNYDHRNDEESEDEMAETKEANRKSFNSFPNLPRHPKQAFIPGVIVHVTFKAPVTDRKKVVLDFRAIPHVLFVDVASDVDAFVRCDALSATLTVLESLNSREELGQVRLLEGEEEKAYWKTIESGMDERRRNDRNKGHRRGKAKVRPDDDSQNVIEKAEVKKGQAVPVHIKFEDMT